MLKLAWLRPSSGSFEWAVTGTTDPLQKFALTIKKPQNGHSLSCPETSAILAARINS